MTNEFFSIIRPMKESEHRSRKRSLLDITDLIENSEILWWEMYTRQFDLETRVVPISLHQVSLERQRLANIFPQWHPSLIDDSWRHRSMSCHPSRNILKLSPRNMSKIKIPTPFNLDGWFRVSTGEFFAISSGKSSNFLHAYKDAYCTQHFKNLELARVGLAIKFLHGPVLWKF